MTSVGQKLKTERLRQGKDLKTIADDLRISSRYLQAIETEDWSQLPGGFFGRSFVRQYAVALGLNPADFDSIPTLKAEVEPVKIETVVAQRDPIEVPPLHSPRVGLLDFKTWAAVGALVLVVVMGASLFSWLDDSRNPKTTQQVAQQPAATNPMAPVAASTPAKPEPTGQPASFSPTDEGALSLRVAATEKTWLEISSGGQKLFMGLLEAGQSRLIDRAESARMVVGNAGGVSVRRSGHDIGPIGPRGQVRVVLFRPDAWEILQAPVPAKGASESANTED